MLFAGTASTECARTCAHTCVRGGGRSNVTLWHQPPRQGRYQCKKHHRHACNRACVQAYMCLCIRKHIHIHINAPDAAVLWTLTRLQHTSEALQYRPADKSSCLKGVRFGFEICGVESSAAFQCAHAMHAHAAADLLQPREAPR